MLKKILELTYNQGIWAVLFVGLLYYILKENTKRETKYQEIINKIADQIYEEIKTIKQKIFD